THQCLSTIRKQRTEPVTSCEKLEYDEDLKSSEIQGFKDTNLRADDVLAFTIKSFSSKGVTLSLA
ncbi:hypothetical protein J6590_106988, partial [Homalodisca vitripennis]